jgi:hypothetical protein
MEPVCPYCEEAFTAQPQTELPCHHRYHTQCFLDTILVTVLGQLPHNRIQCVVCHTLLLEDFQQEDADEEEEEHEEEDQEEEDAQSVGSTTSQTRILNLWNTNLQFRKDIKSYQASCKGVCRPLREFQALARTKKQEVASRFALLKAQYEGLAGTKKDEIVQSPEYKAYKSAIAKQTRWITKLRDTYDVSGFTLRHLRGIRGLKSLRRPYYWRSRPNYIIRRALRLRLTY